MRNFEERKAEVFRRSENRIKERKQTHKRILSLCIPLCLALTVCSVTLIPEMLPVGTDKFTGENAAMPEYTGENKVEKVQIEAINTEDTQENLTKEPYVLFEDMGQIYYSMESAFEKDRGNEEGKLSDEELDDTEELILGGSKPLPGYKITFALSDGSKKVFTLIGYKLTDNTTGKLVTLTETQRNEFLDKLRLLDGEETK